VLVVTDFLVVVVVMVVVVVVVVDVDVGCFSIECAGTCWSSARGLGAP
jgi:hypothetical protein